MTVEQMRQRLCQKYPNGAWAKKVAKMEDDQVIAIFHRLQADGVIDTPRKPVHISAPPKPSVYYCPGCCTFFTADNPQLDECTDCGCVKIEKIFPPTLEEYYNED